MLTTQDIHQQLYETVEKGDITLLKSLIQSPITVDTVLCDPRTQQNIDKKTDIIDCRCCILTIANSSVAVATRCESESDRQKSPFFTHLRCPLHFAALKGDIDVMRALIQYKADVNKPEWDQCTPLHYCAITGFIDGAKALLDAGAQINAQTRLKETPLIYALGANQLEMVQFLIDARADIEKVGLKRKTPLFYVSDPQAAQLLINAGANVNFENDEMSTPLHEAANEGYIEVAKVLLANGANVNAVNQQKQTPLHIAAEKGHPEVCELLLNNGAELKVLDVARRSPEMLARRNEHYDVLSIISKYHEAAEDEDTPLLVFKPFSGVLNSSQPPEGSLESEITASDFKFDLSPE